MPIGSHAIVYRPKKDEWYGPCSVLDISFDDRTLLLPSLAGRTNFLSSVAKPFIDDHYTSSPNTTPSTSPNVQFNLSASTPSTLFPIINLVSIYVATVSSNTNHDPSSIRPVTAQVSSLSCAARFITSRMMEFSSLIAHKVFSLVSQA